MHDGDSEPITVSVEITGTWRGAAQQETIELAFTAEDKEIANTKFRFKYGVKPFDTVTAATVTGFLAAHENMQVSLGIGSKIGLPTNLLTPDEDDVVNITKNAADLSPSGIVDTTNMTINLGTLADDDDFTVAYKAITALTGTAITNVSGGAISAAAAPEVTQSFSLTATVRCLAIGI